jgi:predicted N-acetyltransferase YhbS
VIEVRLLQPDEAPQVQPVTAAAFAGLDRDRRRPVTAWTDERREWFGRRVRHFLAHDPDLQWVAVQDGRFVGVAMASLRDGLWGLSLLVVRPDTQSAGVGRRLIDAALGDHTGRGVICASDDGRALRRYAAAGFDVHPCLVLRGVPDAAGFPTDPAVREGVDREFADAVDVAVRGAGHGPDHDLLQGGRGFGLTYDAGGRRGYCYSGDGGWVSLVAGTDQDVATALLAEALRRHAAAGVSVTVSHVTGGQQWALRVGLAARLTIAIDGAVCWRGMPEPTAYLPSGALL